MNTLEKGGVTGLILRYFSGLRFPWIFGLLALLFVVDVIVPDVIPFADELLLGLMALLMGAWRKRKDESKLVDGNLTDDVGSLPPTSTAARDGDE